MSAPYPPPAGTPGAAPNNTFGLISLILGIAAIPLVCCFYIGLPLGIAAAVLGYLGKQKAEQGLATNRGQAMAGLICGLSAIGLGILLIILTVVLNVAIPSYGV